MKTERKQSELSRFAGETNFLVGSIRRLRGAIHYLHAAPQNDDEYSAAKTDALRALARMEARVRLLRQDEHKRIKLRQESKELARLIDEALDQRSE